MRPPLVGSTCGPGGSARPGTHPRRSPCCSIRGLTECCPKGSTLLAAGRRTTTRPRDLQDASESLRSTWSSVLAPYGRMHPDPAVEHRAYGGGAPPRVANGLVAMSSPRGANTARRILANAYGMLSADQKPRSVSELINEIPAELGRTRVPPVMEQACVDKKSASTRSGPTPAST
jgi:hypothetical protein